MEVMEDPVMCADGQTYERRHIVEWLRQSPTSPITRQPLSMDTIIPNYALKASIHRWKSTQRAPVSAPVPAIPVGKPAPTTPLGAIPTYSTYAQPTAYTPPTYNPSYTMVTMPYSPPIANPSYQNQTAQSHISIVPAPVRQESVPLQPSPFLRRITVLLCLVLFIISVISSIIYSQEMNNRKEKNNNDDDN